MNALTRHALRVPLLVCLATAPVGATHQSTGAQKPAPSQARPDPVPALLRQAEEAMEKKDYARAAEALREYLAQRPADAIAHFQLGYAYTALDRGQDARAEYSRAIELNPKLAEAHLNLGLLLVERDPAAAVEPLKKAVELMPGQAQPQFLLGMALERSGQAEAALEPYRTAARLDEKGFDARFALARALLSLNRALEAETHFREALALRADAAPARLGLAESLIAQKKLEEAAAELAAYLRSRPEDQESRLQLASVYTDLGRYESALAEADRAEAGGLRSAALLKLRAEVLTHLKRISEAAEALAKALGQEPQNADLHARLGRLRLEQRDFPAAERELVAALRLNPKSNDALRDLVAVYYLGGDCAATLSALEELSRRETLSAGSWFVRATCYDRLAKKAEALAAYEQFLALDQGRNDKQNFQARQRVRILTRALKKK